MKIAELNREELSERLILSVVNIDDIKDSLSNYPNIQRGPFAILSQLCLGERNIEGNYTSLVTVTNDIMSGWNSSHDEIFELAIKNSRKAFPVLIEPINCFVSNGADNEYLYNDAINLFDCLVLTNQRYFNGAAALFYEPDVLDKIANKFKTSSLFLLPSSTNYIFCIPQADSLNLDECKEVFNSFLSDSVEKPLFQTVMTYDVKKKEILYDNHGFSVDLIGENHAFTKTNHR